MKQYAILRLLLAGFFLYLAVPFISEAVTQIERLFWSCWLIFLLLVVGGNFATIIKITSPPVMEQEELKQLKKGSH